MRARFITLLREVVAPIQCARTAASATSGPPPKVKLEGNADPAKVTDQHAELNAGLVEAETQAAKDEPPGAEMVLAAETDHTMMKRRCCRQRIKTGNVGIGGSTGAVLERSLTNLQDLIAHRARALRQ